MSGLEFSIEKVDLKTVTTEHNQNYLEISPRGQVPLLVLDDGTMLTENIAIAQYIADKVPLTHLLAPIGNIERSQTLSWLSYVATELHQAYGPLFRAHVQAEKDDAIKSLDNKFSYIDKILSYRKFISSNQFTIADAYLYTVLRWRNLVPNFPSYPNIDLFMHRIETLPAVQKALAKKGL